VIAPVKDEGVSRREAARRYRIGEAGSRLRGGRLYSPDLNPIEMAFAKLKHLLRKAGE